MVYQPNLFFYTTGVELIPEPGCKLLLITVSGCNAGGFSIISGSILVSGGGNDITGSLGRGNIGGGKVVLGGGKVVLGGGGGGGGLW
jgi:hypothetical protein